MEKITKLKLFKLENRNLIIGGTSQLSNFFPKENLTILSSRNIDFDFIKKNYFNNVYLLFAEQRTFLNETESFFNEVNVTYTLNTINQIKNYCKNIVVYSTSELWNNCDGPIGLATKFNYNYSPYIKSKEIMVEKIKEDKTLDDVVKIVYPFNFNSINRKQGFLFYKIFNSIKTNKKELIGNINFNRDLIHPEVVVRESINLVNDKIVGSGELINVLNFVKEIYEKLDLNINDFIEFSDESFINLKRNEYFSSEKFSNYDELLTLTVNEIKNNLNK